MGGFRPGAGSALAKRVACAAGGAWGALCTMSTRGMPPSATVWQTWQAVQVPQP